MPVVAVVNPAIPATQNHVRLAAHGLSPVDVRCGAPDATVQAGSR